MLGKNKKSKNVNNEADTSDALRSSDLMSKVKGFFDPQPQKEKVLRHEDFNKAGDTYYASVAVGYKISQRILLLVLVLFIVFSVITNFREITYDNFFYLIKDFSSAVDLESTNRDSLSYDSNDRQFFSLYRGGLAVANPSNISVFTATGRRTMSISSKFSSPCITSSEKYFIIYDTAGNTFSVFNSFSKIYSEELEYPVSYAAFSDNGHMAIVTRDISHKSLVHVYNKNFKRIFTVPSSDHAFGVSLNGKDDKLAIAYYGIGDGSGLTEIVLRNISDTEEVSRISITGEFPLKCGFLSDGKFAVITDRALRVYNSYFEETEFYDFSGGTISGYTLDAHGAAVSYTQDSKNIAVVFDKSGNLLYNEIINDNVKDIGLYEGYVFLRTDSGVIRVNAATLEQQFSSAGQGKMLIYSADTALVCGDSKAEYLVFEE